MATNLVNFLRERLAIDRLSVIVDVGSNPFGNPPYNALIKAKAAQVIGFEPQEAAFERLKPRQSEYEKHLPYAIGDGSEGTLRVCSNSGFTSLLEPNRKFIDYLGGWGGLTRVVDRIPMQTKRLDDIDEIPKIDLLKIDIQGGETAVFEAGVDKLENAVMVISEVAFAPIYEDQPLVSDQMQTLAKQGFMLHTFLGLRKVMLIRPGTRGRLDHRKIQNQLTDIDGVFIKDMTQPETLSDDQLKQMALLATGVIQSYDLTIAAIWELEKRSLVPEDVREDFIALIEEIQ